MSKMTDRDYEGLVERLRSWGENSPDPDHFQGDTLGMVLGECTLAADAIQSLLEEREREHADRQSFETALWKIIDSDGFEEVPSDLVQALDKIKAERERMGIAGKAVLLSAKLLLQNAQCCSANHLGDNFQTSGEPGWLADCRRDIERFAALHPDSGEGE